MSPICPYCRTDIAPGDERVDCSGCGTPHHADCFAENGGCTVFGCSQAPVDEPKVTVTGSEAAQAVGPAPVAPAPATYLASPPARPVQSARPTTVERPPSILGLSEPLSLDGNETPPVELSAPAPFLSAASDPAPTPAGPPPPPPSADSTSVPPPPPPPGSNIPLWAASQSADPPLSMAEAYASYHPPKSRVTFVLLGIFLGALGVHNFYAGYIRKAVFQLFLTLLTCFYGSIVSWIWAVVEVCIVKQDSEGVQFTS